MNKSEPINLQYTTIKDPLPGFIYEGIREYSDDANSYKPQPLALIEKISEKHSITKDKIFLTAGADEGIQMFSKAFGENAFVFTPTYVVYADVRIFGGKLTEMYSVKNYSFDIDTSEINGATLIFLANPNNPSGFTSKEKIIELVKNNKNAVVVIDEAYGDFAPELSMIDQLENYPNLSILRSFSKGYGMAGNRIGYIVSHPEIISKVKDYTQWANVSYLSVGAASVALDHEDYFKTMRDDIAVRREEFVDYLKELNYKLLPSKINAVIIKFGNEEEATKFFDHLAENNIVVSHGNGSSNIGLDRSFVRIAIGNNLQMESVKKIISDYKK